jgi:shikimate kinase
MAKNNNVYLIGPMGSGKSAVGRRLSAELKCDFYDCDEEIERRTGVDIPFIFDKEGEEGFRRREVATLEELVALDGIVLATGGGAPMNPDSRALLQQHGTVVYLYTTVAEQLRRTGSSRQRPLLDCDNPGEVLEQLMAIRDPVYRDIADIILETDGKQVPTVSREIKRRLKAGDAAATPANS